MVYTDIKGIALLTNRGDVEIVSGNLNRKSHCRSIFWWFMKRRSLTLADVVILSTTEDTTQTTFARVIPPTSQSLKKCLKCT
jgi:hypothetical protein